MRSLIRKFVLCFTDVFNTKKEGKSIPAHYKCSQRPLASQLKVAGLIPGPLAFCVEFAWVPSELFLFPSTVQRHTRLIGNSKLPVGVKIVVIQGTVNAGNNCL